MTTVGGVIRDTSPLCIYRGKGVTLDYINTEVLPVGLQQLIVTHVYIIGHTTVQL